MTLIRFPVEPLVRRVIGDREVGGREIAAVIGTDYTTFQRWHRQGGLTLVNAEAVAHRCSFHPVEIWPDYYDRVIDKPVRTQRSAHGKN